MTGKTLAHYHITGKLGAGGMSEVWRARGTRFRRLVTPKILPEISERAPLDSGICRIRVVISQSTEFGYFAAPGADQ
jgi:hypothetical protein